MRFERWWAWYPVRTIAGHWRWRCYVEWRPGPLVQGVMGLFYFLIEYRDAQ
jgi:hypothetical protein